MSFNYTFMSSSCRISITTYRERKKLSRTYSAWWESRGEHCMRTVDFFLHLRINHFVRCVSDEKWEGPGEMRLMLFCWTFLRAWMSCDINGTKPAIAWEWKLIFLLYYFSLFLIFACSLSFDPFSLLFAKTFSTRFLPFEYWKKLKLLSLNWRQNDKPQT